MPPSRRDSEDISCSLSSRPQKHVRRIQEQNRLDHHSSCITYAVVQPSSSPPSSVSSDSMPERQRLASNSEELHLLSSSPSSSHTTNQHISSFIQKALFSSPPSSTALFDPSLGMMPSSAYSWGYQLPSFPSSHTTRHPIHSISQALKSLFSSLSPSSLPSSYIAAASPLTQPSPSDNEGGLHFSPSPEMVSSHLHSPWAISSSSPSPASLGTTYRHLHSFLQPPPPSPPSPPSSPMASASSATPPSPS